MKKLIRLTEEQKEGFIESLQNETYSKFISNILDIDLSKYDVGDTAVKIENAKVGEIYENEFRGKTFYYYVINAIDEKLAFCNSFYPSVD